MTNGSKLYPGLLAGSAIGVLSSLPFVNLANCCCVWIFGGGMLASYLYQQDQDEPITVTDALAVGAIAAVSGAVIGLIVSIPIHYLTAPIMQRLALRVLESSQDVPAEFRSALERVSLSGAGLAISFFFSLVLYGFFVPAGALVGGLMFQKAPRPMSQAPQAPTVVADLGVLPPPPPLPGEPAASVPLASRESAAASSPREAGDDGDDDLPPSSTPPSQPPPLPSV